MAKRNCHPSFSKFIPHVLFKPHNNPTSRNYHYLHFTDENTDAQSWGMGSGESTVFFLAFLTVKKPGDRR